MPHAATCSRHRGRHAARHTAALHIDARVHAEWRVSVRPSPAVRRRGGDESRTDRPSSTQRRRNAARLVFMICWGNPTADGLGKLWTSGPRSMPDKSGCHIGVRRVRRSLLWRSWCSCGSTGRGGRGPGDSISPALGAAVIALRGTIAGVYPRLLFELAQESASTLGAGRHSGYDSQWTIRHHGRTGRAPWPTASGRLAR